MKKKPIKTTPFDTKKSLNKVKAYTQEHYSSSIVSDDNIYTWSGPMQRVEIIRQGIPFSSIEQISDRLNRPIKAILSLLGMPQTTYNKKKSERSLLDSRDSELIVLITELLDYGVEVFNNEEEKFQRWLKKPNLSLGSRTPESLLDTVTGLEEVKNSLNRIEYGNFA